MNEKLLSLNIIAGANDAAVLDRCLSSFPVDGLFDEIVIVLTSSDVPLWEVAKKYTDKVFGFTWSTTEYPYGDFAGARNLALQNSTCQYVMWLDSDDYILSIKDFEKVKNALRSNRHSIFICEYVLELVNNKVTKSFLRERIFRRVPAIFWERPIHERLTIENAGDKAILRGFSILHSPVKPAEVSASRNIAILRHEVFKNSKSFLRYFLAKELIGIGETTEAIKILKTCINDRSIFTDDVLAEIYLTLATELIDASEEDELPPTDAETYLRIALAHNEYLPMAYSLLGCIYRRKNELTYAMQCFRKALSTKYSGGGVNDIEANAIIPLFNISNIYSMRKENEKALAALADARKVCVNDHSLFHINLSYNFILKEIMNNEHFGQN